MNRRNFITLVAGLVAWPLAARAQQSVKVPRIGYLSPGSSSPGPFARHDAFREGLRELGYVEGRNIAIEYRFADGKFDRLAELAAELVGLKVDVIVAAVTQASLAAKNSTSTIPVVMMSVGDPVGSGLVSNLARPGANVTGTSSMTNDVMGKTLALLKESVPRAVRVALLRNPGNVVFQSQIWHETEAAARSLGLELQPFGARSPDELDGTFAAIAGARADALLVQPDPILGGQLSRIVDLAHKSQLPAMYGAREYAVAGGLMAYGPDYAERYRRAAAYVDKILRGTKPGDIPVEQPTKFEFVINLKTAKALGLDVPPTLLARADEVIE